jgi:hypothetical protein
MPLSSGREEPTSWSMISAARSRAREGRLEYGLVFCSHMLPFVPILDLLSAGYLYQD